MALQHIILLLLDNIFMIRLEIVEWGEIDQ